MLLLVAEMALQVYPVESGANKLDVSMLEWFGVVEVAPGRPDWVCGLWSEPIISGVWLHARLRNLVLQQLPGP